MSEVSNRKILIVEDNEMHQFMYKFQFEQAGYKDVMVAGTGQDGLEQARAQKPDLILLDLVLEGDRGISGLEVLQGLKGEDSTKDIPVVVLSNKRAKDMAVKVKNLGAEAYLLKADYVPREVVAYVNKFFNK